MTLILKNDKFLLVDGKLAFHVRCCCCGPCDPATPCHAECCCVDGTCVPNPDPGQPCGGNNCDCLLPYQGAIAVFAEFTVTLKEGETNCITGTETKKIQLTQVAAGEYSAGGTLSEIGPARLAAIMYCSGGQFYIGAAFNSIDYGCAFDYQGDPLSSGGIGVGKLVDGSLVAGNCVPPQNLFLLRIPQDLEPSLDPSEVGVNITVQFIVEEQ